MRPNMQPLSSHAVVRLFAAEAGLRNALSLLTRVVAARGFDGA